MIVCGWLPRDGVMTCFAVRREPPGHMSGVSGFLESGLVAIIADRGRSRVAVVYMALDTRYRHMSAGQGKSRCGMIERCRCPGNRGVAGLAVGREPPGHMGGVCRFLEIGLMAIITECRCAREPVVHMALYAWDCRMGPGQRKSRRGMIERRRRPCEGGVAGFAVGREPPCHMSGVYGFLEIGLVAPVTSCRCTGETVVYMALSARDCRVGAGQLKGCPRMVVPCRRPRGGGVTHLAIEREGWRTVNRVPG